MQARSVYLWAGSANLSCTAVIIFFKADGVSKSEVLQCLPPAGGP